VPFYQWLARIAFQNTDFFLFFAHMAAVVSERTDARRVVESTSSGAQKSP
jgi:hypothetical protein